MYEEQLPAIIRPAIQDKIYIQKLCKLHDELFPGSIKSQMNQVVHHLIDLYDLTDNELAQKNGKKIAEEILNFIKRINNINPDLGRILKEEMQKELQE